jgi:transcriptional regulator with XRE-family HTH domain
MATGGTATSVFGRTLKRHREDLGLSQEELADASEVAARTISDLERGVAQRPRAATVRLLAAGLGLSGTDLEEFTATARGWRLGGTGESAVEGMGGVGKTALALRAAHLVAGQFPDGQLFIDLKGYTPGVRPLAPQDALSSLLVALGVAREQIPVGLAECAALYRGRLASSLMNASSWPASPSMSLRVFSLKTRVVPSSSGRQASRMPMSCGQC